WLIDEREHFLRLGLGRGEKARAQSRRWKYRFANFHFANSLSTVLDSEPLSRRGRKTENLGCSYPGCTLPEQTIIEDVDRGQLRPLHSRVQRSPKLLS